MQVRVRRERNIQNEDADDIYSMCTKQMDASQSMQESGLSKGWWLHSAYDDLYITTTSPSDGSDKTDREIDHPSVSIDINRHSKTAIMAAVTDVLKEKYPAKAHAKRVAEYIAARGGDANGTMYIEGQRTRMIEDNDGEAHFRSVSMPRYSLSALTVDAVNGATSSTCPAANCRTRH